MEDFFKIIGVIAGTITSISVICAFLRRVILKGFEPIYKKIDNLDESQCKNFLVTFLKSVEKGEKMDEVEIQRAYEVYDHYINELKKNSYIHNKWEKIMK